MHVDQTERAPVATMAKIIPIRRDAWLVSGIWQAPATDRERGRHFLKVTLPAIPVAVFTLTFLLGYFLGAGDLAHPRFADPLPVLLTAIILTAVVSGLCVAIYSGYKHVTGLTEAEGLR
jgi:hypothetical protein